MKTKGITAATLKWIAIISMFIDHFGWAMVSEGYCIAHGGFPPGGETFNQVLHILGRLAFPIFCFFIAEGYRHTHNAWRYAWRMLLFGFLSEVLFDYAFRRVWFSTEWQNIYFTLFLGLAVLIGWDLVTQKDFLQCSWWRKLIALAGLAFGVFLGFRLRTDYYGWGVLMIFVMYILRDHPLWRDLAAAAVLLLCGRSEIFALPSLLLLHLYNGQRGRQNKNLFYWFYPGHLAFFCLLRFLLYGL